MKRATAMALVVVLALLARTGRARTLDDYRYFRALTIDLVGRTPTPDEIGAFERDDFDTASWLDRHLQGPAYAERVRRIYMDALRLEVGPTFQFDPPAVILRRQQILGPDGHPLFVYFRNGQRRVRPETDGDFCLTTAETGLQFPRNAASTGVPHRVDARVLDTYTMLVRPWWLYLDDRAPDPNRRYGPTWDTAAPGFVPAPGLLIDADGHDTMAVRVCREEASTADTGTVLVTGRTGPARPAGAMAASRGVTQTLPPGRLVPLPGDTPFARRHEGERIPCGTGTAFQNSAECGCGVGLERCMPGDGPMFEPRAFVFPSHAPLGFDDPFDRVPQSAAAWERYWWAQEAVHFIDAIVRDDRDIRELLTSRGTVINGPLAQFYRDIAPSTCCGPGAFMGYVTPDALFDPAHLPDALRPQDVVGWTAVDDRGPHASGLLTMPIFLTKYGSRRARAHVLYNTFLCRDFVAETVQLTPSTEPDLRVRPGCSTCHATLEPMAASFSRIAESDWTWYPATIFPVDNPLCARADERRIPGFCRPFYDPAFTHADHAFLRSAYASPERADAGARGLAEDIVQSDRFAPCVARTVGSSFLGRPLTDDDDSLVAAWSEAFVRGGYRMRALVRAVLLSDAYRRANNLTSDRWRVEQGGP